MNFIITNAFKDKKKYFIFYLLFQIIFLIAFLLSSNYEYYNYQIKYVIGDKEVNRELEVRNNNNQKIFDEITHIEKYHPLYNNQLIEYDSKYYQLNQIFDNDIRYGKEIENDNEMVISVYFFKQMNLANEDLGRKEIEISYDNKDYKFIIVGVTNNNYTQMYISLNAFNEIFKITPKSYYILVDKYTNIPKVQKYLEAKDISSDLYSYAGQSEIEEIKKMQKHYVYMLVVLIILVIYFIKNTIKNIITSESKNIAILKALGYKNKTIKRIMNTRLTIVITCTYFVSLILILIISIFIKHISTLFAFETISLIYALIMTIKYMCTLNLKSTIKSLNVLETLQDI